MIVPALAAVDDSKTKYHFIKYVLYYPDSESETDTIIANSITNTKKYETKIIEVQPKKTCIKDMCMIQAEITYINSAEADITYQEFKSLITKNKIIYGVFYHTLNSHHWKNPEPDQILEKIEIGKYSPVLDIFN